MDFGGPRTLIRSHCSLLQRQQHALFIHPFPESVDVGQTMWPASLVDRKVLSQATSWNCQKLNAEVGTMSRETAADKVRYVGKVNPQLQSRVRLLLYLLRRR